MKTISLFQKFLALGLAGLSAVSPLEAEWGSGDHLGTINNGITVAASIASAATTDTATQTAITAAAQAAPAFIAEIAALVTGIKAAVAGTKAA